MAEFSYFMIRIQRLGLARPATLSGVVERLGTGETRPFSDGAQLLELLGSWFEGFKMQPPAGGSNREERDRTDPRRLTRPEASEGNTKETT